MKPNALALAFLALLPGSLVKAVVLAMALVLVTGCNDEASPQAAAPAAAPGAAGATAAAATDKSVVNVGPTEYLFTTTRCDFSGASPDGMLLRGSGSTPDGRPFTVMVERIQPGDIVFESVTLYFGSIVEGDMWVAKRAGQPDGSWLAGDGSGGPVDGPLLRADGGILVAEGEFLHETTGGVEPALLVAGCVAGS